MSTFPPPSTMELRVQLGSLLSDFDAALVFGRCIHSLLAYLNMDNLGTFSKEGPNHERRALPPQTTAPSPFNNQSNDTNYGNTTNASKLHTQSLMSLPTDVLKTILKFVAFVEFQEDLVQLRCVCKLFRTCMDASLLQFVVKLSQKESSSELLAALEAPNKKNVLFPALDTLPLPNIAGVRELKPSHAKLLLPKLTGVSVVEFRHHFQDDENPEHFCQMLPVTLTTLNLRYSNVTDDFLLNLGKYCPRLRKLNLEYCGKIRGNFLQFAPPTLSTVLLECAGITDESLALVPETVTELDLSLTTVTAAGIAKLHKNVQKLKLAYCKTGDESMLVLPPQLHTLVLYSTYPLVTDAGIRSLPRNLKSLTLQDIPGITDAGLLNLPPSLEHLTINYHPKITDEGLKNILAVTGKSLKFLSFKFVDSITAQGISAVPAHIVVKYE